MSEIIGLSIYRISSKKRTITLEGEVVTLCLVNSDMCDIPRKSFDKVAEWHSNDTRKGDRKSDKLDIGQQNVRPGLARTHSGRTEHCGMSTRSEGRQRKRSEEENVKVDNWLPLVLDFFYTRAAPRLHGISGGFMIDVGTYKRQIL